MSHKRNKNKQASGHSSLNKHQKVGTKLVPPLARLNMIPLQWDRDLLPEHLWIASLAESYPIERIHKPFSDLLDAIDTVWPNNELSPSLGMLTDFGLVPLEKRTEFKTKYRDLIYATFHKPIGRLLAFFPECPAYWLIDQEVLEEECPLKPETEIPILRKLVFELMPGKTEFPGHIRTIPFQRPLKHGKMHFSSHMTDILDLLPKYPTECTEDEKKHVQSFTRNALNMTFQQLPRYQDNSWPKYFWRHCYDLVVCEPTIIPLEGSTFLVQSDLESFEKILANNADLVRKYIENLHNHLHPDLYDPTTDEILFGLFARALRLAIVICENPALWSRDMAGIMLRCLAETTINFAFLAKCGQPSDFSAFKSYGEGQEKLLMLHLQDNYPAAVSLEGRSSKEISSDLGGFMPELIQIELGSWSKTDARELAQKAGMQDIYRLVFSPSSADIHGSWVSLKHSNLSYCTEPLHRFHRLPSFSEPPIYLETILAAFRICERAIEIAETVLKYPKLGVSLSNDLITLISRASASNEEDN
jgi:hypothetical protein